MFNKIKNIIFFFLYLLVNPYLLKKINVVYLPVYVQYLWLIDYDISYAIDIGTYNGRECSVLFDLFPNIQIYAFEPDVEIYTKLVNKDWKGKIKIENVAVSDSIGFATFYQNKHKQASSLLEPSANYKMSFPTANKLKTKTITLDKYFSRIKLNGNVLLKIDVQGLEAKILKKGTETLKHVSVVHIESSFDELYEKQGLFYDIYALLTKAGFIYIGNIPDGQFYPIFEPQAVVNSVYINPEKIKVKYRNE